MVPLVMELVPLYSVTLVAENGKHHYQVEGDPTYLPGVTGILQALAKHALVPWSAKATASYMVKILKRLKTYRIGFENITPRFLETFFKRAKKQPRFEKESAGRFGTACHLVYDFSIRRKMLPPEGKKPAWDSFLLWTKNEKLKIIAGDTKIASKLYGYGGSLDALAQDESGTYWIIDFKTSNALYDSYALQVAAYGQAFRETFGQKEWPRGVVIRFDKEWPKFERRIVVDMEKSFEGFKVAMAATEHEKICHLSPPETVSIPKPRKSRRDKPTAVLMSEN